MGKPAARVTDPVVHPLPGILTPGPGSFNVHIGSLPAWRGIPAAAAAALQSAKAASDATIKSAEAATAAAAGTPGLPAAKAAEEAAKTAAGAAMSSAISGAAAAAGAASGGGMVDIHVCATPLPIPPHGPGVVIDGSPTVLINGLPSCRQADTILEALGPPNKIAMGMFNVHIGEAGVTTGLGADVDTIVNMSPTLQAKIKALQADGWVIEGAPGNPDECDKEAKIIRVDTNDSAITQVETLAHEVGHASYEADPYVPVDGKTKQEYVDANLKRELKDEGEATLSNIEIRDEIMKNGGPDIGIAGNSANHPKYQKAYEDYKKSGDRDKAREDIGAIFADGEKAGDTGKSYRDYYSDTYKDHYDKTAGSP